MNGLGFNFWQKLFDKSTNHFDFAVAIIGRYPVHSKQIEGLKLIY